MKLFNKFKQKNNIFQNQIIDLMKDNFNVMYIPLIHLFDDKDTYYLKYPYSNFVQNKTLYKENVIYNDFDTVLYLENINNEKIVAVEIQDKGTLVFTNHLVSTKDRGRFSVLTRKVFCDKLVLVMRNAKTSTEEK